MIDKNTLPQFPNHQIDPKDKGRKWIRHYLKAAWHSFAASSHNSFYSYRSKHAEIKDYVQGKQTINKYKPLMGVDEYDNTTYLSIDWKVLPILPKFRDMALGRINKVDYNLSATPVDPKATSEMEEYFSKQKARITLRNEMAKIDPEAIEILPLAPKEGEPMDAEELDIYKRFGYKHRMAVEMEQAIELVLFMNKFGELRKQVKSDVFDFGVGGYKEYVDSNGAIKIRRLNPSNLIVSTCQYRDFSDIQHCGEVLELSISELKQWAGDAFSADEYEDIAKNVMNKWGNPTTIPQHTTFSRGYDTFKVRVLDMEFFSIDDYVYEKGTDKRGNTHITRTKYNAKPDKKDVKRKAAKVVYKGCWIIGTDYIFNYGRATNMKRAKSRLMDTKLSYHLFAPNMYAMRIESHGERAIPIVDQIQLAWYKYQQAVAEARPRGIMIEIGALEDVPIGQGGAVMTPMDILDLYYQKGVLIYRKEDVSGNMTNYKPIEELQNGIGDEAARWFEVIQANIQLLRDSLGLNELTDGSTPDARTLTTVANMAAENTNNSLFSIIEADQFLFESLCESLMLRVQSVVKRKELKGYKQALGSDSMEFISVSPEVSNHEFGIRLELKPDDIQRERLLQAAQARADADVIEFEDLVLIQNTDNLKMAEAILAHRIKKRKDEAHKRSIELQQANAQAQMQSAQSAEQAKQQTLQVEYTFKTEYMNAEYDRKMQIEQLKLQGRIQEASLSSETKLTEKMLEVDSNEYQQENQLAASVSSNNSTQ